MANLLCGCLHGKTTFPITLQASTYVVCLECGRHLRVRLVENAHQQAPHGVAFPSHCVCLSANS